MLKNHDYSGGCHEGNIHIRVQLENPSNYGISDEVLLFSIEVKNQNDGIAPQNLEYFTFYIMDESDRLYNTRTVPYIKPASELLSDDELLHPPDGLISVDFRYEFLFQDLRIAVYNRSNQKLSIIELKH